MDSVVTRKGGRGLETDEGKGEMGRKANGDTKIRIGWGGRRKGDQGEVGGEDWVGKGVGEASGCITK